MPALILSGLLYFAVLFLLLSAGFLTGMAAMDWLIVTGVALGAVLASLAVYRGALRKWVRGRNHPLSLRILAGMTGTYLWFIVISMHFWSPATQSLAWNEDPRTGALVMLAVLLLGATFLAVGYGGRRRIRA